MVARFVWYKNHKILFHALSEMRESWYGNFRLSLLWSGGYMMDELREKVQVLWLADLVIFLEKVPADTMPEIYKKYDILVLPSFNEAVWMVVPEANASWIPAVVSPTVGAQYYIIDRETGFIFPSLEVGDIKKHLCSVLIQICFCRFENERDKEWKKNFLWKKFMRILYLGFICKNIFP